MSRTSGIWVDYDMNMPRDFREFKFRDIRAAIIKRNLIIPGWSDFTKIQNLKLEQGFITFNDLKPPTRSTCGCPAITG